MFCKKTVGRVAGAALCVAVALWGLTGCKEKAPELIEITAENYSELDYNSLQGVRLKFLGEWTSGKFIDLSNNLSESIATNVVIDMSETQAEKLVGFFMCGPVVEVIIGPGVKQVGSGVSARTIEYLYEGETINNKLQKNTAFAWCQNLRKLTVAPGVERIGFYCFMWCYQLQDVTVGAKLLVQELFNDQETPNIRQLNLEGVETIGKWAFNNNKLLETLVIPDSVTKIHSSFQNCASLKSASFGTGLTTLSTYIFSGCSALEEVTLGPNMTKLERGAFENCTSLASITIPEGVTEIEREVFLNCSALASIKLPTTLTTIGKDAFKGCTALDEASQTAIRNAGYEGEF